MVDVKKIAIIGGIALLLIAGFLVISSNQGGTAIMGLLLLGCFGGVAAFVFWYLNKPKVLSPTKRLFEALKAAGNANVPDSIRGYRLMTKGDRQHSPVTIGNIVGWVNLTKYAGFDYIYEKDDVTGKSVRVMDANGTPKRKYWKHAEDVIMEKQNYDHTVDKIVLHKKGEIRKWNESNFVVKPLGFINGLFGRVFIIRVPEEAHSALNGDVSVYSISFMPLPALGDLFILNEFYNSPQYRQQLYDEIEGVTFNMTLDNMAISVDKAMNSNVDLGLGLRGKDQIIPQPARPPVAQGGQSV